MEARLSANNSAKRVWCQALIDSHIFLFIQAADVQVSTGERKARSGPRLDEEVVEFPPTGVEKNRKLVRKKGNKGEVFHPYTRFSPHTPSLVICLLKNCNQSEMQSAKALVKKKIFLLWLFVFLNQTLCILSVFPFFVCLSIRWPHKKRSSFNRHQKTSLAISMITRPKGQGTGTLSKQKKGQKATA